MTKAGFNFNAVVVGGLKKRSFIVTEDGRDVDRAVMAEDLMDHRREIAARFGFKKAW